MKGAGRHRRTAGGPAAQMPGWGVFARASQREAAPAARPQRQQHLGLTCTDHIYINSSRWYHLNEQRCKHEDTQCCRYGNGGWQTPGSEGAHIHTRLVCVVCIFCACVRCVCSCVLGAQHRQCVCATRGAKQESWGQCLCITDTGRHVLLAFFLSMIQYQ